MLFPALKITFRAERRYEMAYVTVPKDLTKIKSKVMFNLTKRQLICFSAAVAIGLPPAHFGVQSKRFTVYFEGRGAISFQFCGKSYAIFIESATCFPQSFSAAAATVKNLASIPKVLVVDIGGFTADYVCLRNGGCLRLSRKRRDPAL
mgnify:CR=1 FL=1